MSRYPIFVPVSLVTDLSPDQCFEKLRRRRERGFRKPLENVVHSIRLGSFLLAADSYWSWINNSWEPKFLGRVSDAGPGTVVSGYLIPGFGFLLGFSGAILMTIYLVYLLVVRLLDPATVYSLRFLSPAVALLIFCLLTAAGWFILLRFWKPLVWDDPKIIQRLSKLLAAEEQ